MTTRSQHRAYVTQGHVHVRSLSRLVSLLVGGAILSWAIWGVRWQTTICLTALVIFGVILLFEFLTVRYNERKANGPAEVDEKVSELNDPAGFVLHPEFGWYERYVEIEGRRVAIRSGEAPVLRASARACAEAILHDPRSLSDRFRRFKMSEVQRASIEREEIAGLELEAIDFFNPDRPAVGEVSFSEESGGESWTCLLDNGTFRELRNGT